MNVIQASIKNPVSVIVGIILIVMFGIIGLFSMPYQLSPDVTEPEITVRTQWNGATPYEIERDIIEEQEDVLKGLADLTELSSSSQNSLGEISLKFEIGTDLDDALLRVSNKLNEVPSYPLTADKPVISATGASANPVIWMMLKTKEGNETPIDHYRTFFEDEVRQFIERVDGVADLFIGGGTEDEMHIIVDPVKLAAYDLTIEQVANVLQAENMSISAGNMDLGRRQYRIRTVAEYRSPEDIEDVILTSTGQRRVRLGEVGYAEFGHEKREGLTLHNNTRGLAIGVRPEPGTNILDMTDAANAVVDELNAGMLADEDVFLDWVYDERPYINGAIERVQQNILIGASLAIIVLLVFLRSVSSTIIVALAIPISVIGSFIFMNLFGRNLNVVSLAGISFAVGMLVDSAIVVLENIDRHKKQLGKPAVLAAYDGAKEVWGAVLASTATTVAVFLPVVFMQEEAGQLFKDIAIAVTCAVIISLFVSIAVIPTFAKKLFCFFERREGEICDINDPEEAQARVDAGETILKKVGDDKQGNGVLNGALANGAIKSARKIFSIPAMLHKFLMWLVGLAMKNVATRITTIVSLTAVAVLATWAFFPKMEYLPQGNRNLIVNILVPPPGLSVDEFEANGRKVFAQLDPFLGQDEVNGLPGIENCFYVGHPQFNLFGVITTKEQRAAELIPMLTGVANSLPGVFGVSIQAGIFQQRLGGGRSIDVDISGDDLPGIMAAGGALFGAISQAVPGAQVRPVPSLELSFPEIKLLPNRDRVIAAGMTADELGRGLDVLMDGRQIGDFKQEGKKKIDLVLKASEEEIDTPEELYDALLATPDGRVVPVSSLASLDRTTGITSIRHLERRRTVTLQVTPPAEIPLETAMETIEQGVIPQIKAQGLLDGIMVRLAGAADKLTTTRQAMQGNFLLAIAIIYLLMSALFGNFIYPFIILFTLPLAAAGGFIGLQLQNIFLAQQPMDILTMLGFVILIGVVVNNAILIVHQSLNNIRDGGMGHKEAVMDSVRTRLRPIFMSATTSIFGMLPLAVFPGPGSELYRGLGSVILGGLAISTIFTVFVIPTLLMFFIKMEKVQGEGEAQAEAQVQAN